jgi:phosphatidylglycerol:prolipoprotein diacylglycerol transferase
MMAPTLSIAGAVVQTYVLVLLLAASSGLWLSARQAKRLCLNENHIYNLGFYALVASLLGARLVYVLAHWAVYGDALLSALDPRPMGLSWTEGALVGGLVAIVYWNHQRLPVGATLDAFAPGLALSLALERFGAFLDGRHFGEPTTLPWGVVMWDEVRHPVQLYEMATLLIILGFLWWRGKSLSPGDGFVSFVAFYAGLRLFFEAFRANAPLMDNGLRATQVIALVVMLGAVGYLYRRRCPSEASATDAASVKID